uniref:Uncharacterized protein n=1 Tax=Anopheles albimanus TaxID=7167 RepID=A0A182FYZ9_ANOAL
MGCCWLAGWLTSVEAKALLCSPPSPPSGYGVQSNRVMH